MKCKGYNYWWYKHSEIVGICLKHIFMNFIFLYKRVFMFESFKTSFIKSTDCFEILVLLLSINVIDLVSQNRFEMKYKKSITIR